MNIDNKKKIIIYYYDIKVELLVCQFKITFFPPLFRSYMHIISKITFIRYCELIF